MFTKHLTAGMTSDANLINHEEKVLITGGTGLVGSQLSKRLKDCGFEVAHLSRSPRQGAYQTYQWDTSKGFIDAQAIRNADRIIHLAGAGVADRRWSPLRKKEIYDSRIGSTKLLLKYVKEHNPNLKQFVSASAIGYYGADSGSDEMNETSSMGVGFLAEVVRDWEKASNQFQNMGVKTACLRIGIVLSEKGGALQKIVQPIKLGAGAALGSGDQYMSWIDLDDLTSMFLFLIENDREGIYNAVSPNPCTNKEFTRALAKEMNKPLFLPNVPEFVLKFMLGERAQIVLGGNNVSSKKIVDAGFNFSHPTLPEALHHLLG